MTQVQFKSWQCHVQQARYANGRVALQLVDAQDGEPIATATVNVPEAPLAADEVLVKSYSENTGMLEALEAAGIVKHTGGYVQSGYVQVPVCKLLGPGR